MASRTTAPQRRDLYMTKDVKVNMTFTLQDETCNAQAVKTTSPFDLTGYNATLKVRTNASSPEVLAEFSTLEYTLAISSNEITWTSGANTWDGITPNKYVYELFCYSNDDDFVACWGELDLAYKITRKTGD